LICDENSWVDLCYAGLQVSTYSGNDLFHPG